MKRIVALLIFFIGICLISFSLFYTGQEHTLVIDNKYEDKSESKNIVFKVPGQKDKKISKNKKAILELKGIKHEFIVEIDGTSYPGELKFPLNKGSEILVENFLTQKGEWIKTIPQY
ncbi:DUF6672 family protein [Cetobacterium sp.]|uniref:DUF6672 family protein n=1 Tax=Cetobacterium sp. TaxID=2071632 RepID=UPI002FCBE597